MKYIFFGNPEFSAIVLDKLIKEGLAPSLVVCNPDKPAGRRQEMRAPVVKGLADKNGLSVLQPKSLSTDLFEGEFDFFLVAAYGKLIPKEVLDLPRLGAINVHPSLLPKYRGPSPIQSAILNGDDVTGVSLILLDEKVDHGSILKISNFQFPISKMTYVELEQELAKLAGEMLVEILPKFAAGEVEPKDQGHSRATFTRKFTSEDGFVDYSELIRALDGSDKRAVTVIERKIRALNPEPGVWTITNDEPVLSLPKERRVKILEVEIVDGKLKLKKAQVEGKSAREI